MEDDFERMFMTVLNKMLQALNSDAMGVKISVSPEGDVRIDPIKPRKRRIYIPFEVVDLGEKYLVTLDLREVPKRASSIRVRPDGVLVETPKGERFIYFKEKVDPETTQLGGRDSILELTINKGENDVEKVIRLPE